MGYQVYKIKKDNGYRWGGYGVPAICEHPKCNKEIDRGMDYACGGEPFSQYGCDRYFCGNHLVFHRFNTGFNSRECKLVCERCAEKKNSFPYKPEAKEWLKHILKDKSWEKWRKENSEMVDEYKNYLKC